MPADPPGDAGRYVTVAELAARGGVSKSLIYKLVAAGRIPYLRNGPRGKVWLPHDALEHAVASERHAAAPPTTEPMQSVQGLPAKQPGKRLSGRLPKWQAGGSS